MLNLHENRYIPRTLERNLRQYLGSFPVTAITGPRQSGKSTMLKNVLPDYTYVSLDDFRVLELFNDDPEKFMRIYNDRIIFDEAHLAPKLFTWLKIAVDKDRNNYGKFVLTGSAQFTLLKNITESLAGRIGLLSLLPFQYSEIPEPLRRDSVYKGSYPELVLRNYASANAWYSSYVETYLNKDIRSVSAIGDLSSFRKFISLLATRCSQILNMSELARDLGINVPTVKRWISVLEASYIVFLVQPYYNNLGKRLYKAPKLYFHDTGLVSYLLRVDRREDFENGPMHGPLFENYLVSEIMKKELHAGSFAALYYLRTNHGSEVDLILERGQQREWIEIKAGETFRQAMVKTIEKLKKPEEKGYLLYNGQTVRYTEDIAVWNYREYLER